MNALTITLALAVSTGTASLGQPAGPTPVVRASILGAPTPGMPAAGAVEASDEENPSSCLLLRKGSEGATVAQCTSCHQSGSNHPAGLDYASAVRERRRGSNLREAAEVVRRGVFLPEGELRCVTCHDRRSPWRWHLALPPNALARPAVDPHDPSTYDPALDRSGERDRTPPAGSPVSPKPLCLACHAVD